MKVPERFRVLKGPYASDSSYGNNGCFKIFKLNEIFWVICSDGMGWEHVSVHVEILNTNHKTRTPYWGEMCWIKDMFFHPEETVIQFHPKKSEYVNQHPNTLHLWRPTEFEIPLPEKIMV